MTKLKAKAPELIKPGKIKAILYGVAGVGKTMLALSFPKPYYYDTEGGAKGQQYRELLKASGGVYLGPEDGTLSFDTLIEEMKVLATEQHPYKTLIIDSISKLYQTTIAQEAERLGDRDAFGASKKPAVASMRRLVMWCGRLDMNILFLAHEVSEWGIVNGQRSEIGRVADIWEKLLYELDLAIQVVKRGPQRLAIVKKTRLLAFPDGEQFPLEYAEFATRYGRESIEGDPIIISLATPEQIAEVNHLLEVVKVSEDEIQKWYNKAKVDTWADMTSEDIGKVQTYLKKKLSVSV